MSLLLGGKYIITFQARLCCSCFQVQCITCCLLIVFWQLSSFLIIASLFVWCADFFVVYATGPFVGIYYSSQFAPLVVFFLLFLSVVKNTKLHHFVRFNAMQVSMNYYQLSAAC